ncbi:MAG: hypothetical protein IRZ16_20430 [Myxococcaceae bacterium]|nr:hypothetical protein [Myxococcaceae bacterium]
MGRREQARRDAAFARGEIGVDGAAVEEARDAAEVEQDKAREQLLRGRTWIGREFLTWLLWRSEEGEPLVKMEEGGLVVLFTGRIVLRGIHGEVTELSARGTLAPYSEIVKHAIDRGCLVHQARIRFTVGERVWEAMVDAEHFDVKSAKLPELLTDEEDDRQAERLDLTERLSAFIDALVDAYLAVRRSRTWSQKVVPELKAWARGDARTSAPMLQKATRARRATA